MRAALLLVIVIVFMLLSVGIASYLGPDDLGRCGVRPGGARGCERAEAIVAVSGGDTLARTRRAVELYRQGWADWLVFSGAALDTTGPSNAEVMRSEAIRLGVPERAVLIDPAATTTRENAENVGRLLAEKNVSSVILVTSAYHQRRANLEVARSLPGKTVFNAPVAQDNQWAGGWWWLNPYDWYLALSELVKIAVWYGEGVTR